MFLRAFLLGFALLASHTVLSEEPDEVRVKEISDLTAEAREARDKRLPILLMFAADHCPYCHLVEDDFLEPMLRSGEYEQKVLIRKIDLDNFEDIKDFDGSIISPDELASRFDIRVTPTLVFIDHQGRQLAGKMAGLTTPDYYGGYIDQAIDTAIERLKNSGGR